MQTSAKLSFLASTERLAERYLGSEAQKEQRANLTSAREHNCVVSERNYVPSERLGELVALCARKGSSTHEYARENSFVI